MTRFAHQKQILVVLAVLSALAIGLAACAGSNAGSGSDADALRDTSWVLVSLGGRDLIPGTTITLRFAAPGDPETAVSGRAGCNTYGGGYKATQESLTFSGVYATEMACMDPAGVMEQERAYLNALSAVASFKVAGDQLELFDAGGVQMLVFAAEGTVSAPAIVVVAAMLTQL